MPTKKRPPKKEGVYCVIGVSVTENHPIKRSWKDSQKDASAHADRLIENSNGRTKRLLVVKVVEVIEVCGPPLRHITSFSRADVSADAEGE